MKYIPRDLYSTVVFGTLPQLVFSLFIKVQWKAYSEQILLLKNLCVKENKNIVEF